MAVPIWIALVASLVAACSGPAPLRAGAVRVVSLHDVTTEVIVALGAADHLVGVAEPVDVDPAAVPAVSIASLPRVGDLESILAVRPTLVVGLSVVAAQDPELVTRLGDAGIAVYLPELTTLGDVLDLDRALAARIGVAPAGMALADRLAAEATAASGPATGAPSTRVFVYDCCDPPFTTGARSVLSDLITRAGGVNIFGDLAAGWTHVGWEAVVARRPELVVIDAYRYDGQGDVPDKQRAVRAIAGLAGLPTVVLPLGWVLGGLRSAAGIARVRAAIRGGT